MAKIMCRQVAKIMCRLTFLEVKNLLHPKLCAISERPIYVPGQNQVMEFVVHFREENDALYLDDILYCGKNFFMIMMVQINPQ